MRVMGVDPGTLKMGVGIVDSVSGDLSSPYHSCISPKPKDSIEKRLATIFRTLEDKILEFSPDYIAVEQPFVSKNPKTAIAIGQAQAVVLISASLKGIPVARYSPSEIKKSVTNYGGSTKDQVSSMVSILLGNIIIEGSDDVSDALAVAICHHNVSMLDNIVFR